MTGRVLPPDPNVSGWHWLGSEKYPGQRLASEWMSYAGMWWDKGAPVHPARVHANGWRYLCPVPTPARIAALEAEIGRLQVAFRVNAMRWGFTKADIDEILFPDRQEGDEP